MPSASSPVSEPASFAYSPGDVIANKYALDELLGAGGMGAVFRARNTTIDMPVAIKLIRADLDRDVLTGRLLQEARAAAKLAHPAIVRVFDVGKTALGDPFIVMELLQGETLASLLEREGRLTSARAVQLLLPIADALAVAHGKGLVHRDVKPDNVFIANDEEGQLQPKLVDFGIVKAEQTSVDGQLTQVGAVIGSPDYMSPEQARGLERVDLRSDVWSFAIVLYETIVGETPFQAENYNALLRLIVETVAPTLAERSVADAELSAIVQRGMSKDPDDRFASMGQMGRALALWLQNQGISEDACGVSLDARWLSRPSDATHLGRVSRSSTPAGWPEPPSGVRAVQFGLAGKLAHATTIENAQNAGTPVAMTGLSHRVTPRERRAYLMAAGALLLVATVFAWIALRPVRSPELPQPPIPAARPLEATPEPSAASSTLEPPSAPASDETALARTPAPPASAPLEAKPAPTLRASNNKLAPPPAPAKALRPDRGSDEPSPPAAPPPKPASDLLTPY